MNKELKAMIDEINDKKNEIRKLVEEGEIDKAKAAKEELKSMQDKFELLVDLEDKNVNDVKAKIAAGKVGVIGEKNDKKSLVNAVVDIVKSRFLGGEASEESIERYKNALTSSDEPTEEGTLGIGVTIPEDIRTDIIELRRASDELQQYVNVENVTTKKGSRNIEVNADEIPFDNVDEAADFPEMDEPEFKQISYLIKKKGGILKITAELLEDTAQNVMAYVNKWIAKKTKTTRNLMILKTIDEMTSGKEVTVSNVDGLKDIFNVSLDPAIAETSVLITNQHGFNYLDKLKDSDGNYILQKDPTQKTAGKLLFGTYPVIVLSKKTLKSEDITEKSEDTTGGEKTTGVKHPIYCGDLNSAITLFDRNVITIDINDRGAGLWEKDMSGVKVRDRFDVQPVDDEAVVKGVITEVING